MLPFIEFKKIVGVPTSLNRTVSVPPAGLPEHDPHHEKLGRWDSEYPSDDRVF